MTQEASSEFVSRKMLYLSSKPMYVDWFSSKMKNWMVLRTEKMPAIKDNNLVFILYFSPAGKKNDGET
jgi:hypothetical protein